jgi:hypothetical protein
VTCPSLGRRLVAVIAALAFAQPAVAAGTPDDLLVRYAALARQEEPGFAGFSAERGRGFYFEKHVLAGIGEASCASCHLEDPRLAIRAHRAPVLCRACHVINDHEHPDPEHAKKRHLPPFAPTRNPERFNDFARVERYFEVNCRMLMKRDCTAREKGDLITWLLTLR